MTIDDTLDTNYLAVEVDTFVGQRCRQEVNEWRHCSVARLYPQLVEPNSTSDRTKYVRGGTTRNERRR
eukprot:605824-Heterocapsa_arctica.AAC.1